MATINTYRATQGLAAPAAPSTPIDTSLAQAVKGIGGALDNVGEMLQQRKSQREEFKAKNGYQKMSLELGNELQTLTENAPEDGAGLHEKFMREVYEPRINTFLEGLGDPRLKERYQTILGREGADRSKWSIDAATKERDRTYTWAENEVLASQERLATAISLDPEGYDDLLQSGLDEIDSAPLPTVRKEALKRQWRDEVAPVAQLNRLLETNPEQIVRGLNADVSHLSPTTQYNLLEEAVIAQESGGSAAAVSPKGALGLMQVMPGTARDIARWIKDGDFPTKGDPAQVAEYLMRPAVNRRYGSFYLKKQLRDFDGDIDAALIAYNGGPERAKEWLAAGRDDSVLPKETRDYYRSVKGRLPGSPPKEAAEPARFVWVRNGAREVLTPDSPKLAKVNGDLQARAATAFGAVGVQDIRVNSGFRSKQHNKDVGGANHSQHLTGNALDIDVSGMPAAKRVDLIRSLSANGITGIGVYSNALHIDMGSRRAWGSDHSKDTVPKWARAAIAEHMNGTARPSGIDKRYATLSYDKRQQFISKADQAITARYNTQKSATALEKVQLNRAMDNELASIAETGQTTGFDDTAIAEKLGDAEYTKWAHSKDQSLRVYNSKQGIATMSSEDMSERLQDYKARPGSASFEDDKEVEDAVQNEIERVTKLRSTQPSLAAMEYPDVKEAYKDVLDGLAANQPDTEAVQNFIRLNLERQKDFNIAPDAREPIPRPWALEIGRSVAKRVPEIEGSSAAELRTALAVKYMMMQELYGEYTDEVITYSLKEYKGIGDNTAEIINNYMAAISAGGDPLGLDPNRAMDRDQTESNSGRGWFSSLQDWWTGDGEADIPETVDGEDAPSPDLVLEIMTQMADDMSPADEVLLTQRYGAAAVEAAKRQRAR